MPDPRTQKEGREVFLLNEASKFARMAADARKSGEEDLAESHMESAMEMINQANIRRQSQMSNKRMTLGDLLGAR